MTLVCIQLLYLAVVTSDFDKIKLVNQTLAGKEQPGHSAGYLLYVFMSRLFLFSSPLTLYMLTSLRENTLHINVHIYVVLVNHVAMTGILYLSFQ